MIFKCRVCAEKDKRIEELKSQIEDLKSLVMPRTRPAHYIPPSQVEADGILSGKDEIIELTPEQTKELDDMHREADRIFAGNY